VVDNKCTELCLKSHHNFRIDKKMFFLINRHLYYP
jgi:hypothetical protein